MTWSAVFTDIDGTVVPAGDVITPATLAAAVALRDAGIPLVAVTARTPAGVARLGAFAAQLSLAVVNGGSRGWDPATGATLWEETIPAALVDDLVAFAAALPGAGMSVFGVDAWKLTPTYLALRGAAPREPWELTDSLGGRAAYGAAIRHPGLTSDELLARLTAAGFASRVNLTYSSARLVDIGPLGVDKGTGVRRALAHLGRDAAHAIAFGDMPNDLPMLAACAHSVAVADAHPAVLAGTTATTLPVTADGFAHYLTAQGKNG